MTTKLFDKVSLIQFAKDRLKRMADRVYTERERNRKVTQEDR
jgi:hypothetical protein